MIVVVFLVDALGWWYLPKHSFWRRHSVPIRNSEPTITAPNFTTILTGKHPAKHGVMNNEMVGKPSFRFNHSTFFDDYPGWKRVYVSNWAQNRKFVGPDVDFVHTRRVWDEGNRQIEAHTGMRDLLLVLNHDVLDSVAHLKGWGSAAYLRTFAGIDKRTREFAAMCDVLVGTADHGGLGEDHEDAGDARVRTVPLLYAGSSPPKTRRTTGFRAFLRKTVSTKKTDAPQSDSGR